MNSPLPSPELLLLRAIEEELLATPGDVQTARALIDLRCEIARTLNLRRRAEPVPRPPAD